MKLEDFTASERQEIIEGSFIVFEKSYPEFYKEVEMFYNELEDDEFEDYRKDCISFGEAPEYIEDLHQEAWSCFKAVLDHYIWTTADEKGYLEEYLKDEAEEAKFQALKEDCDD